MNLLAFILLKVHSDKTMRAKAMPSPTPFWRKTAIQSDRKAPTATVWLAAAGWLDHSSDNTRFERL